MSIKRGMGFTLIELVIVIAILGVLSAIALPKFTNMLSGTSGARAAAVVGQARTFMASVQTVQAAWQSQGASSTSFTYNGSTITVGGTTAGTSATTTGWPVIDSSLAAGTTTSALWGLVMRSSSNALPSGWAARSTVNTSSTTPAVYPAGNGVNPAGNGQIMYYLSAISGATSTCGFVYAQGDGTVVVSTTNC